jgi:hypothetical protein
VLMVVVVVVMVAVVKVIATIRDPATIWRIMMLSPCLPRAFVLLYAGNMYSNNKRKLF